MRISSATAISLCLILSGISLASRDAVAEERGANVALRSVRFFAAASACGTQLFLGPKALESEISHIGRCIAKSPENPFLYVHRADAFRRDGNIRMALNDLERSLSLERSVMALFARAEMFRYVGQYDQAIVDLTEILVADSDDVRAYTMRGLTYEKQGQFERARADYQIATLETATQLFRGGDDPKIREACLTAQARLEAITSGATQPAIPPVPAIRPSPTSLPTPNVVIPRPVPTKVSDHRVALVIGNSAYRFMSSLENPKRDAEAVATSLRNVGFSEVIQVIDGTREALRSALANFTAKARRADWSMIYFAGHGIEVDGKNYLIPIDGKLATDRNVSIDTIELGDVIAATEGAAKLKLIVLDACRDNPFLPAERPTPFSDKSAPSRSASKGRISTRSSGDGLAEVKVSGATLVVYAAKHGQSALDGDGQNSPFAVAFVQRLATPGVEINKVFRLVRDDVIEATAGRQEPFTYGSLPGSQDFFFVGR